MSLWIFRSGSKVIRKYARRAAEHIISKLYAFIEGNIVLHFAAIAYKYIIRHIHILPKRAIFTNPGARLNMAEMPYLRTFSYLSPIINNACRMYRIINHQSNLPSKSVEATSLRGSLTGIPVAAD